MAHFTAAFFVFLRDLKEHNDRDWFAANRDRFVADVEGPMLAFIGDVGPRLRMISPAYVADRRRIGGSMFRIHRDTRFGEDKSPFKTWMAARFPHEARRKVPSVPSFYVHLGLDHCFGGGGAYHVDRSALTKMRQHMVASPEDWASVRARVQILGEQLKRAPTGFASTHEHVEDLKRQNLYTLTTFSEAEAVADDLLDRFIDACARAAPLVEFQTTALWIPGERDRPGARRDPCG